jgi:hypothetical protein
MELLSVQPREREVLSRDEMSWPAEIPTDEITAIYLAANTPMYLFKRLRASDVVERLAERVKMAELAAECSQIMAQGERSADDVAKAYALIVALARKGESGWREILSHLNLSGLDWGDRVRGIALASTTPTSVGILEPTTLLPRFTLGSANAPNIEFRMPNQKIILVSP